MATESKEGKKEGKEIRKKDDEHLYFNLEVMGIIQGVGQN